MDWDAVKQVDIVTIGDDGDEYDCGVDINDGDDDEISTKVQSFANSHIFDQNSQSCQITSIFLILSMSHFVSSCGQISNMMKGLASYCQAKTTFTFYFSILTLSNAFLSINNREVKSESGFSSAMASQPL